MLDYKLKQKKNDHNQPLFGARSRRWEAPRAHQRCSSSLMSNITSFKLGKIPLKHSDGDDSKLPELLKWWWDFALFELDHSFYNLTLDFTHQSSKETSSCWGVKASSPTCCRRSTAHCQAKTHETRNWSIVSSSLSHNKQHSWCGNPA